MQSRFDQHLNALRQRKERLEDKIKLPAPPNNSFFKEYKYQQPKLNKLNELINHIQDYEKKTNELIGTDLSNSEFYQSHLDQVEHLLEAIETKYRQSEIFSDDDFNFTFTSPKPYKITDSDKSATIGKTIMDGIGLGMCIAIVAGLIAAAALGITSMVLFGMGPGIAITIVACAVGVIAGYIVGALFGSMIGLGVGLWNASSTVPTNNRYINNTAFDCSVLKAAYQESVQIVGNDERVEGGRIISLD